MATFRAIGTAAAGTTALSVPYPAGVVLGDMLVLHVVNKYPTNGPATPAGGWTAPANGQATGGAGVAGVDTGPVYSTVFHKVADAADVIASGAAGTLAVTVASGNSAIGRMTAFALSTATATWDVACAIGASNVAGTAWSATAGSDPGLSAGDQLCTFSGGNADGGTVATHAYSATGAVFVSPVVEHADGGTPLGEDCTLFSTSVQVITGPATAAPVYTATRTVTNSGATVFMRLRELGGTDGPNAWRVPASAADLEAVSELALSQIWPCQDAAGVTLTAAVRSAASPSTLAAQADTATLGLGQQAVAGWTRKAIGANDNTNVTWRRASTTWDIAAQSVALTGIWSFPSLPAAQRPIAALAVATDGTAGVRLLINANGTLSINCGAATTAGVYNYVDSQAHFIWVFYNRTAGTVGVQTDKELITTTYDGTIANIGNLGLGFVQNTNTPTAAFRCLWAGAATGLGAERNPKLFLQRMGVTVADTVAIGTASAVANANTPTWMSPMTMGTAAAVAGAGPAVLRVPQLMPCGTAAATAGAAAALFRLAGPALPSSLAWNGKTAAVGTQGATATTPVLEWRGKTREV